MTDEEREKRERREKWLLLLIALIGFCREEIDALVDKYAAGLLDAPAFGQRVTALLQHGHTFATYYGAADGNDAHTLLNDDVVQSVFGAEGNAATVEQSLYLADFVQDLVQGRYLTSSNISNTDTGTPTETEDALDVDAIKRRARMYADRIAGTANSAWLATLPPDTLVYWIDTKDRAECTQDDGFPHNCLALANDSPHKAGELKAAPGNCMTPCLVRCRCLLRTEDGDESFDLGRILD